MRSKLVGSTLIIAGTTIGAGMLALPLASAGLGFVQSSFIMVAMWLLMSYTALLMLEIHQHAHEGATLNSLARQFLGRKGQILATFATLFLLYALCAAYIAGGGSQLNAKLIAFSNGALPDSMGTFLFTFIIAGAVMLGTHKVDFINRCLFLLKIVLLCVSLGLLTPHISMLHLTELPIDQGLAIAAIPVMFTSFGFHGSIPSVVAYTGLNIRTLRKVMLFGSSLPLIIYLLWQGVSFGVLSQNSLLNNDQLPEFINAMSQVVTSPYITSVISLFADLALATSFLGVSLGLFDFLSDALKRNNTVSGRLQTGLMTFVPPMLIALFYPQGFVAALGYAAIALVLLAVVLPVLMARKVRQAKLNRDKYQVFGGNIGLSLAMIGGFTVVASQLALSIN
ncbi:tyrosine transporter TyrP [Enterovibrio norvegicus]|uniref:aromatic amino acid transport family protein n=1 Tax=Enterovibrio norvegicus TaxID=188144 RepID=UPI00037A5C30|nr:aromatic amino acid transport family protein [Enterovibrio norvegicus]MCC4796523.1 aromatic amino acid transporter [Enterovibrio norvegicus]OEF52369.1 tyrosine transporter TyrP [Enterovibrio norvegicus]PMI26242.1 tyrosine transporter TyrP [Enterovibrio norvegicus]PMI35960.1 tyrosine transporter TyrP [Enterovibrio norvegicus]PMN53032.1 tyrosine transporter TyrP [Enterovibrio norvegicus]